MNGQLGCSPGSPSIAQGTLAVCPWVVHLGVPSISSAGECGTGEAPPLPGALGQPREAAVPGAGGPEAGRAQDALQVLLVEGSQETALGRDAKALVGWFTQ